MRLNVLIFLAAVLLCFSFGVTGNVIGGKNTGLYSIPLTSNISLTSNIAISMNAQGLMGAISVSTNGNVGIGTASPTNIFEVQGGTASAGTSGQDIRLTAQDGGSGGGQGGSIYLTQGNGSSGWPNGKVIVGPSSEFYVNRHGVDGYRNSSTSIQRPPISVLIANDYNFNNNTALNVYEVRDSGANTQYGFFGAVSIAGNTPALVWGQSTGASSYSERMRLDQNGNLGIGTSTPNAKLEVAGTVSASALQVNGTVAYYVVSINATQSPYSAGNQSFILANCLDGAVTISLPSASTCQGRVYEIKKTDTTATALTISPASGLIDDAASVVLTIPWHSVKLVSDGNHWFVF